MPDMGWVTELASITCRFFCQWIFWNSMLLASGSQVWDWSNCVHPLRLRRLYPWRWCRYVWDNYVWTYMRFVDVAVKICYNFPIIFYDVGLFRRSRFGTSWTHLVRERGVFSYSLFWWRVQWLVHISCNLGKISESWSIATIWESPMLENGALGTGFCRACANLYATMMIFS